MPALFQALVRLEAWGIPCEWLFSTFIEDDDLFFGGEEALRHTLLEARVGRGDALLGVAVNCAPALIGDDVRGISSAAAAGVPVAAAEAGGFTGEFDDGYGKAFLAVLEALRPGPCPPTPETVNLIGFSPLEEHAAENLAEIKRQLFRRGIEVHLTFGVPGTTVESIRKAGRAALNVVLHEGRGQGPPGSKNILGSRPSSHRSPTRQIKKAANSTPSRPLCVWKKGADICSAPSWRIFSVLSVPSDGLRFLSVSFVMSFSIARPSE